MPDRLIREARAEDIETLAEIYLKTRRATFTWVSPVQFHLDDFAKDTEGERVLVAARGSQILGFASVWLQDNFIHNLFVAPQAQGQGCGLALLNAALGLIQRPARLKCAIKNLHACAFYEKHGWKIESTSTDGETGPYHTYVLGSTATS